MHYNVWHGGAKSSHAQQNGGEFRHRLPEGILYRALQTLGHGAASPDERKAAEGANDKGRWQTT